MELQTNENKNKYEINLNEKEDKLNCLKYDFFVHNRYKITDLLHENIKYEGICNNGFTKLHTTKGKAYWLAQNEIEHLTPDWKFHVSVVHEDCPKAWDLLMQIFIENECRSGMKVIYLKETRNSAKGREITIYIYKYDIRYENSEIAKDFKLSYSLEHSQDYWLNFYLLIEDTLDLNKIKNNGLANGDKSLGGKFVSLRNEAYIINELTQEFVYPPDSAGWNASNHELPFDLKKFSKKIKKSEKIK